MTSAASDQIYCFKCHDKTDTLEAQEVRAFSFSQVAGESVRGEPVEPRVDGPATSSGLTWKVWVWRK